MALGVLVAALSVAAITLLIFPLKQISSADSNGVAYLVAVLLVSTIWGMWLGIATSVASALAFNYFHLPPTGQFTIAQQPHLIALIVFLVAAIVASAVAELARSRASEAVQRRREADLAAQLARTLLGGATLESTLDEAARALAAALGLERATIVLGGGDAGGRGDGAAATRGDGDRDAVVPSGEEVFELRRAGTRIGVLVVDGRLKPAERERVATRVVPSLETLIASALERDRLQAEVVETRAFRRSDELKTALLRTISHDLRTPLTAIMTAGAALTEHQISSADREELGRAILAESERLTALIEKVLDLSRLQSGVASPRREWVSIDEILREVANDLDPRHEHFHLSIDADLPLIRADAVQLERAFANLLENASRYSGAERVSVRARVVGERLMIRVVDRGPGIAPEELSRIFEAFYRAPGQQVGHTGSGLGLAIVKGFVEANGGRVWAESLPGQGASFVVALPLEPHPVPGKASLT
jgi:two-component system, OmpR family, sensor histidine kinase KdpD